MIRDIVLKQRDELNQKLLEKYVPRQTIFKIDNSGLIQVIIGPRRAGKSFFGMHHLVKSSAIGFVNFDDERLIAVANFDEILEAVLSVYSNPKTLLLDEIQNLPNWEIIVNRLQRQGFQLIITGSNSNLLSNELATHLTGRHLPVYIFTFSFSEYLASFDKQLTNAEAQEKLNDFISNGGYPEPLMKTLGYKDYLQILFDSILYKDIIKRYRIRNAGALENLAAWLISNTCGEFSMNTIIRQTSISSVHTAKKYLGFLEEAFVFYTLKRFSYKVGEQQRSNKKIYCFDNGFIKAKAFQFSDNHGKLLENAIATELTKRSLQHGSKLFYWKSREHLEVDFVIQQGTKITDLIQVCWSTEQQRTKNREVRSLLKASRELKCNNMLVVTYNEAYQEKFNWFGIEGEVKFVPARKWLLQQ